MNDILAIKVEDKDKTAWGETTIIEMPNQPVKDGVLSIKRTWYLDKLRSLNGRVKVELLKHPDLTEGEKEELSKMLYNLGFKQINQRIKELKFTKHYRIINGKKQK